jgi:hypothetical protein
MEAECQRQRLRGSVRAHETMSDEGHFDFRSRVIVKLKRTGVSYSVISDPCAIQNAKARAKIWRAINPHFGYSEAAVCGLWGAAWLLLPRLRIASCILWVVESRFPTERRLCVLLGDLMKNNYLYNVSISNVGYAIKSPFACDQSRLGPSLSLGRSCLHDSFV